MPTREIIQISGSHSEVELVGFFLLFGMAVLVKILHPENKGREGL